MKKQFKTTLSFWAGVVFSISIVYPCRAQILPPLPAGTSAVIGTNDIARIIEEDYRASIKPTRRLLMPDGHIYTVEISSIKWVMEQPLYRVEWAQTLTGTNWATVAVSDSGEFVHRHPDGFYRVLRIARPSLPPTNPPKRTPDERGIPQDLKTTTKQEGGFQ